MKSLYEQKTSTFWRNEIATCNGNNRRLWQTLQSVLGESESHDTGVNTAEDFAAFFMHHDYTTTTSSSGRRQR